MAEIGAAFVTIAPSAVGFKSKLNSQIGGDLDSSGKTAGKRFGEAMKVGLLAGGAALGALLGKSISSASDAQQAIGGIESVFGKYADTVLADSKKAAQGLGLSATAYNELITVSGAMLKNKGLEDFAAQSKNLVGIGADLSAMFGGSTTQAVEALNAAMRGESDPIERYGISLNETAVNAELAAKGQDKLTGAALEQAKTMARLSLITKQSADASGAFGRESDTLAGQQARLKAQFDNMVVTVGTGLLPVLTRFASFVNSTLLPGLGSAGRFIRDNSTAFKTLAAILGTVIVVVKIHTALTKAATAVTAVWTTVTKGAAVAQRVLNAVLRANPIGLVITALFALGAGLVLAYKKSETFRRVVDGAFAVVKAAASAVANFITSTIPAAFASAVASVVKFKNGVQTNIATAVAVVKAIPGQITAIFSGAGTLLYNAGSQLMSGLAAGIRNKISDAIAEVAAGLTKIRNMLPGSPIKDGPLKAWNGGTPGFLLMEMLAKGITKGGVRSADAMRNQASALSSAFSPGYSSARPAGIFGDAASLPSAIGTAPLVAGGGDVRDEIRELRRDMQRLIPLIGPDVGDRLNGAASKARRDSRANRERSGR